MVKTMPESFNSAFERIQGDNGPRTFEKVARHGSGQIPMKFTIERDDLPKRETGEY
jgi:hypothetical protein